MRDSTEREEARPETISNSTNEMALQHSVQEVAQMEQQMHIDHVCDKYEFWILMMVVVTKKET